MKPIRKQKRLITLFLRRRPPLFWCLSPFKMKTHFNHSPTGFRRSLRAIVAVSEFLKSTAMRIYGSSNLKMQTRAVELRYSGISKRSPHSYFHSRLAKLTGLYRNTSKSLCFIKQGSLISASGLC